MSKITGTMDKSSHCTFGDPDNLRHDLCLMTEDIVTQATQLCACECHLTSDEESDMLEEDNEEE